MKKNTTLTKRKKILLSLIGFFLLIFVFVVILLIWLTSSLFDHQPFETVEKNPDYEKLQRIAWKLGLQEQSEKKTEIASQLLSLLFTQAKTVYLSKEEVNALFDSAVIISRDHRAREIPSLTLADLKFENNAIHLYYSLENSFSTPFGKYLNIKFVFVPAIENNHLSLCIRNISIGSFSFSGKELKSLVDEKVMEFEKTENGKDVLDMIIDLKIARNEISITYNPQKVALFYAKQMTNPLLFEIENK